MNAVAGLAVFLLILWVILRLALAITSGLLNILWIIAIVMFAFWVVGKLRAG